MKSKGKFRKAFSQAERFTRSEDGAFAVVAIVFFAMLIAVGGLAIDLGRLYGVHGQMQAYVDNIALAGATELDGSGDATQRALRAVIGDLGGGPLIDGSQNFADGAAALSVDKVTFLSALGSPDPLPTAPTPAAGDMVLCVPWAGGAAGTACTSAQSQNAKFIEVVATERQVDYFILPIVDLFLGLVGQAPIADSATVALRATAGIKRALCNNIPLMMCNPSQSANPANLNFSPLPGQQFLAKSQGAPIVSPGNFGPLAMWGNGANVFAHGLASINPNTVCVEEAVPSEPGAMVGPIEDGMNVRMDLYSNGGQFDQYPPASNVTKGLTQGPSCKANQISSAAPNTMPFPRHPCFGSDVAGDPARCADASLRVSDDEYWNASLYWATNYNGASLPLALGANPTRYEVYQYEKTDALDVDPPESSVPMCGPAAPPNTPDRRVLLVAIVNCLDSAGNPVLPGGRSNFPFIDIAEVFLTEPVGNVNYTPWSAHTTNQDIFIEMIGKVDNAPGPSSAGVLHVFPVLYR